LTNKKTTSIPTPPNLTICIKQLDRVAKLLNENNEAFQEVATTPFFEASGT
jgi:hypothetical protein